MWHIFTAEPVWAVAIAVVLGLGVGHWLTAVGHHLPRMMEHRWQREVQSTQQGERSDVVSIPQKDLPLLLPGRHCLSCEAPVRGWRRLPLMSWVFVRGRCVVCSGSMGWRYPITELVTACLFGLCVWRFGVSMMTLWAMGLCAALVLLSWIDLHTSLLPDVITLPLLWAGLVMNLDGALVPLRSAVVGAVVGYLFLWLLFHMFRLMTGREGMGYGDFKLLAALGAWFGLSALPTMILIASLVGVVGALCLRMIGYAQRDQALPFGPYLALAGMVMLFAPGWRAMGW